MPRYARMIIPEEKTCYHLISRTALDNFPFGDVEKDEFVKIIKKFSLIYFVEMLGYCVLGNTSICLCVFNTTIYRSYITLNIQNTDN